MDAREVWEQTGGRETREEQSAKVDRLDQAKVGRAEREKQWILPGLKVELCVLTGGCGLKRGSDISRNSSLACCGGG